MSKISELPKQENQGTAPEKVASLWPYTPLSPIELRVAPPGRGRRVLAKALPAEKRDV